MSFRKLLESAAFAAGIKSTGWINKNHWWFQSEGVGYNDSNDCQQLWNPLINDGDAFRLAVKLGLDIIQHSEIKDGRLEVAVFYGENLELEQYGSDPYAATRLAIVRAAAEIGNAMIINASKETEYIDETEK